MNRLTSPVGYGIAFIVLATMPFVGTVYVVTTLTQILCFSLLTVSVALLLGQGGMPSLGQAAYMGVGAYAAGLTAIHVTADFFVGLLVAMVVGLVVALITGPLVMRGRGAYLLMITLALAELLSQVANAWVGLTNGSDGLIGVPRQTFFGGKMDNLVVTYWVILGVVTVVFCGLGLLVRSPFGHTLRGVRDNETRMQALGYQTRFVRLSLFAVTGVVSAIGGALTITQTQYISPVEMNFVASSIALVAAIAGGVDRLWGSFIGAALVVYAQVMLPESWQGLGPLVLGVLLIFVVYFAPGGVSGTITRAFQSLGRGRGRKAAEGIIRAEQT